MDMEKLKRLPDEAQQRRNKQKNENHRAGVNKRLEPFRTLELSNRAIVDRAEKMVGLSSSPSAKYRSPRSPWIILVTPENSKRYGMMGRVEEYAEEHRREGNLERTGRKGYRFAVYEVSQDTTEIIRNNPLVDNPINDALGEELTFSVQRTRIHTDRSDEITELASTMSSYRNVNPINAYKRYRLNQAINIRIDNLSETVNLFEQAITDPALNPQLAARALPRGFTAIHIEHYIA